MSAEIALTIHSVTLSPELVRFGYSDIKKIPAKAGIRLEEAIKEIMLSP